MPILSSANEDVVANVPHRPLQFRIWHLFLLVTAIGVALAFYTYDRSQFDMNSYGNVELPGGGRGDMFVFRAKDLSRPIGIVHYIDGKKVGTIATFRTESENWVIITLPESNRTIRVFNYPSETVYELAPSNATVHGSGGTTSSFARPTMKPNQKSLFFERRVYYFKSDTEENKKVHTFYLLYQ